MPRFVTPEQASMTLELEDGTKCLVAKTDYGVLEAKYRMTVLVDLQNTDEDEDKWQVQLFVRHDLDLRRQMKKLLAVTGYRVAAAKTPGWGPPSNGSDGLIVYYRDSEEPRWVDEQRLRDFFHPDVDYPFNRDPQG